MPPAALLVGDFAHCARARAEGMEALDANLLFGDAASKLKREYRSDGLHWSLADYGALNAALWSAGNNCAR